MCFVFVLESSKPIADRTCQEMKHQPLLIASRWMHSLIGATLSSLALVLLPTLLSAQETAPATGEQQAQELGDKTDLIRAYGNNVFILHSRQQFLENATQLLRDLDAGWFVGTVEQFLRPKSAELIDNDAPWFIYENQLLVLPIQDGDKLAKLILNKNSATAEDLSQPTEIQEMPIDSDGFWFDDNVACIDGKFLLLGEKSEDIKNYQASELLEPELPESSRRLIESSGICWVGQAQLNELLLGLGDWNFEMDRADEAERELLERINQAAGSAQLMLAGATYEQHTLELRQQLLLEENEHVDGLFVFDRPQADLRLGLPAQELVASVAVDFSVLKSRTFPRAIIKQGLRLPFARSGPINPAYELAADLLGDGINEMDTFRVGLYQRSGESGTGIYACWASLIPRTNSGL